MKLLKKIILCSILLLVVSVTYAQDNKDTDKKGKSKSKNKKSFKPHFFSGGSIWFAFGSYTLADVNLVFGGQITERINLGVSGKYQYINDKRAFAGNFETHVYGGSVFSQVAVIKDFRNLFKIKAHSGIIAHIEYEFLNTDYNQFHIDNSPGKPDRYWLHNLLIGGGYFQQFNKKSKAYIIILWDVLRNKRNPYEYPQIRIGFNLGI
ncbi:MAG: hypothetical protein MI739_12710 [Bacteroidales bacterium]|nr:hypothetical protein [Bacteroidales bacterium]